MRLKLVEITEEAEKTIIYIARVSNPNNQENPEVEKLIKYCITHEHYSVFEHAHITLEIETSLAIATQILRHRSFTFQQFSQRYADAGDLGFEPIELRKAAEKNRQSSGELIEANSNRVYQYQIHETLMAVKKLYDDLLAAGVAKECARFILPQCTGTRMYMTGNIRSWIHYIQLRMGEGTQKEHRAIAEAAKKIFVAELPLISKALDWKN